MSARRGFAPIIILVIIFALILGAIGYLANNAYKPKKEEPAQTTAIKRSTPNADTPAKELVDNLKTEITKVIPSNVRYQVDVLPEPGCNFWETEDGSFITLKGFALRFDDSVNSSETRTKFSEAFAKISNTTADSFFQKNGFIKNTRNSFVNYFVYHCGDITAERRLAYSKTDIYCLEWLWGALGGATDFFCGEQDKAKDAQRKEFESAVYQASGKKTYFTVYKILGNYASIGPANLPQDLILKKDNGNWVKVGEWGHFQPPQCSYLDSHNIPRKLFSGCFDSNGKEVTN